MEGEIEKIKRMQVLGRKKGEGDRRRLPDVTAFGLARHEGEGWREGKWWRWRKGGAGEGALVWKSHYLGVAARDALTPPDSCPLLPPFITPSPPPPRP